MSTILPIQSLAHGPAGGFLFPVNVNVLLGQLELGDDGTVVALHIQTDSEAALLTLPPQHEPVDLLIRPLGEHQIVLRGARVRVFAGVDGVVVEVDEFRTQERAN